MFLFFNEVALQAIEIVYFYQMTSFLWSTKTGTIAREMRHLVTNDSESNLEEGVSTLSIIAEHVDDQIPLARCQGISTSSYAQVRVA